MLDRIPEGEEMCLELGKNLAQNCDRFAYDDSVSKSLRMEVKAVAERINSAKAGLMTWKDHLRRVTDLERERAEEVRQVETDLAEVAGILKDKEASKSDIKSREESERDLKECKVGFAAWGTMSSFISQPHLLVA